jgi:hypothetical protein
MRKSIHHGSETSTAKCERGVAFFRGEIHNRIPLPKVPQPFHPVLLLEIAVTGKGIILRRLHVTVFGRVVMEVIEAREEIALVANAAVPILVSNAPSRYAVFLVDRTAAAAVETVDKGG